MRRTKHGTLICRYKKPVRPGGEAGGSGASSACMAGADAYRSPTHTFPTLTLHSRSQPETLKGGEEVQGAGG